MGQELSSIAYNDDLVDLKVPGLSKLQVNMIKEHFHSILQQSRSSEERINNRVLARYLGIPVHEADQLIKFVDLDGDGLLDEYDFVCMVGLFTYSSLQEKLEAIFGLFDDDYSQLLDDKELANLVRCVLCVNENGQEADKTLVKDKLNSIYEQLFLHEPELTLADFITFAKEDPAFQGALKKLGVLRETDFDEDYCEDIDMEINRGQDAYRQDAEKYERRRHGLELDVKEDGVFQTEEVDEGDQFMAVKPYLGVVKNSVPSDFDAKKVDNSEPSMGLELEYVHGYRCFDTRNNLRYTNEGNVIFHSAAVGVVMDPRSNTQKFNTVNTDDIICMDMHGDTVATGQIGHKPIINLWSASSMETLSTIVGVLQKGIAHVAFSRNGQFLAGTAMNDDHDIAVYDVSNPKAPKLVVSGKGVKDVVLELKFSQQEDNSLILATRRDVHIATFNKTGLKIKKVTGWQKKQPSLCIGFNKSSDFVVGLQDGSIASIKGRSVSKIYQAHKQAVFAIWSTKSNGNLFTGGGDGNVIIWDANFKQLKTISINTKSFTSMNPKVRALCYNESENKILVGTRGGELIEINNSNDAKTVVLKGHFNLELWGLTAHPTLKEFVTCGEDFLVAKWSTIGRKQLQSRKLKYQAKCCGISSNGSHLAVGYKNGHVAVLDYATLNDVSTIKCSMKEITVVKYSKDNRFLAVGARDAKIYILGVAKNYAKVSVCKGHHSTITHLDFSVDSNVLQSTCTSYELLYWDVKSGKQDTRGASGNRDEKWNTWSCTLGWPVQGIYPPCSDGLDVNSVDRAYKSDVIATGDDFGGVKLFRFPCLKGGSFQRFVGHSSHVTNVKFINDDSKLISVGGNDKSVFQWKIDGAEEEELEYVGEEDDEGFRYNIEVSEEEDNNGMFNLVEEEAGDEFMAVKPFEGEVKNSVPSDFKFIKGMDEAPEESLQLEYVNGYRCFDARQMAKITAGKHRVAFASAALGVELDISSNTQTFFNEHEEDVISFDIHPERQIAASGQMAMKGKSKFIDIFVWDIATKQVLSNHKGFHIRAIQLIRFSPDGSKLFTFGQDDDNSLAVYDWKNNILLATAKVDKTNVHDCAFLDSENYFITVGSRHVKAWTMSGANLKGRRVSWKALNNKSEAVLCCQGVNASLAFVGTISGNILTVRGGSLSSPFSAHKGRVSVMHFEKSTQKLYSGGNDGVINEYSLSGGKLKLMRSVIALSEAESLNRSIRTLDVYNNQLLFGTRASDLFFVPSITDSSKKAKILTGHYQGELWGMSCHPSKQQYVTCGDDSTIRLWDISERKALACKQVEDKLRACHYAPNGNMIVVGTMKGKLLLYDGELRMQLDEVQTSFTKEHQWIEELKFSPDSEQIALGAHGGPSKVEVYKIVKNKLKRVKLINAGLTSALLHLDWSADGGLVAVNSRAYELKYVDINAGRNAASSSCRDIEWSTWTCKLGFPVQGIFPRADGSDVNAVCRSNNQSILATGDDYQLVKIFKYPSVKPKSGFKSYKGHSSHVTRVRFSAEDQFLVSTGGNDKTTIIWRTSYNAPEMNEDPNENVDDDDYDETIKPKVRHIKEPKEAKDQYVEEDDAGLFNEEITEEGTEFMAVKPWLGAIKAPSSFTGLGSEFDREPNVDIELEYVYGYRTKDTRNNLYYKDGKAFYYAAALGIRLDIDSNTQSFLNSHRDDVISMAYSKAKNLFATGELGPRPLINIWNPDDMSVVAELKGGVIKGVCALGFSPKGDKLAAVCIDDKHTVVIFDMDSYQFQFSTEGGPSKIVELVWTSDTNFATVGIKHYKYWTLSGNSLSGKNGLFGKNNNKLVCVSKFGNNIVAGAVGGDLQVWSGNSCSKTVKLHKICLDALCVVDDSTLLTGGKDCMVNGLDKSFAKLFTLNMNEIAPTGISNKVRALAVNEARDELLVGVYSSQIFKVSAKNSPVETWDKAKLTVNEVMSGHYSPNVQWTNEVWGLAAIGSDRILTVSDDATLRLWSTSERRMVDHLVLNIDAKGAVLEPDKTTKDFQDQAKLRSVCVSMDEKHIAVGCKEGTVRIIDYAKWQQVKLIKRRKQWIEDLKFSPNNEYLAVGSHDNIIDIYDVASGYKWKRKLHKHSSYITHIDWSVDSCYLHSNCGAYELLFWSVEDGQQLTSGASALRDEDWHTWSCVLGWPVQGIFLPEMDGGDINMTDRSHKAIPDGYRILAAGDDFGKIRVYPYPCLKKGAKAIELKGHSSHVTNVKFNGNDSYLYSAGGEDQTIMQWRVRQR